MDCEITIYQDGVNSNSNPMIGNALIGNSNPLTGKLARIEKKEYNSVKCTKITGRICSDMIGIIGAMEEEISTLVSMMDVQRQGEIAGSMFYCGSLEGKMVALALSGIGKVNMAVCAQIMIDIFRADCIINTGVAGSLDNRMDIGDIVFGTDAIEHDMDCTVFDDPLGQVPRMDVLAFPCDKELIEIAERVNARVNPGVKTFKGRIVTGDQFISSMERKDFLITEFGAMCCEMEGAALAHTAYMSKVPCLIVRSISDKADGSATMDYPKFKEMALVRETALLVEIIKEIREE